MVFHCLCIKFKLASLYYSCLMLVYILSFLFIRQQLLFFSARLEVAHLRSSWLYNRWEHPPWLSLVPLNLNHIFVFVLTDTEGRSPSTKNLNPPGQKSLQAQQEKLKSSPILRSKIVKQQYWTISTLFIK